MAGWDFCVREISATLKAARKDGSPFDQLVTRNSLARAGTAPVTRKEHLMDTTIHLNAVRRYSALAGNLEDPSQEEHEQALSDLKAYGDAYLPKQGCGLDKAALLLRFMHEVCRIPLWQARQCAIVIIESEKAYHGWQSEEVATLLAQETGNILVAEATASLYIEAAKETAYEPLWREVLEALHYGEVVDDEERSVAERSARTTLH